MTGHGHDTSGSVAGERLCSLLDAGDALLGGLRVQDRVALLSFSTRVRLLAPLTPSRDQIRSALRRLEANGLTERVQRLIEVLEFHLETLRSGAIGTARPQ